MQVDAFFGVNIHSDELSAAVVGIDKVVLLVGAECQVGVFGAGVEFHGLFKVQGVGAGAALAVQPRGHGVFSAGGGADVVGERAGDGEVFGI